MLRGALAFGLVMGLAAPAFAGPIYTFNLDQSAVSGRTGSAGTVTLTQDGSAVDVQFVPTSGWGILNTGGPHTPFAFNIASPPGNAGLQIAWITPTNGAGTHGSFTLDTNGGSATPHGSFNTALDYSAGNGTGKAYFGDLDFTLGLTGGTLSTDDFVANNGGYYFAADITDGNGKTGSSAANTSNTPVVPVPEPPGWAVFAVGLAAFGFIQWRRGKNERRA